MSGARVLVIDDDQAVRSVTGRLLASAGYVALEAADGAAALHLLAQETVDAVLMDLRMPGISGRDLYRSIRDGWPALAQRIVVTSGGLLQDEWFNDQPVRFLAKPFDREQLLQAFAALPMGDEEPLAGDA